MEYRLLGRSGLKVPALSFGTATFGGGNEFFRAWGATDVADASHMLDLCFEAGVNLFDTADVYSDGLSEEILGQALAGRRHQALIATKASFRLGSGPNDVGNSRHHLIASCEASLRRLKTDYIDLYQLHGFDSLTPVEETMYALDTLVRSGKVRYVGCSNFSGWHLMKALGTAERHGWAGFVSHQAYYSLVGRDFEWELMPLGVDQNIGTMVWSPLGWGRLTGKIRRGSPVPELSRLHGTGKNAPPLTDEHFFNVMDVIDSIAAETNKSVPQIALNWLLHRPTISSVILGARDEAQLRDNLQAAEWQLSPDQLTRLNKVSSTPLPYPYYHQQQAAKERNPLPA